MPQRRKRPVKDYFTSKQELEMFDLTNRGFYKVAAREVEPGKLYLFYGFGQTVRDENEPSQGVVSLESPVMVVFNNRASIEAMSENRLFRFGLHVALEARHGAIFCPQDCTLTGGRNSYDPQALCFPGTNQVRRISSIPWQQAHPGY